jgi:hypothetical protein
MLSRVPEIPRPVWCTLQFTGATGTSSEMNDLAIPAKDDTGILIETNPRKAQ